MKEEEFILLCHICGVEIDIDDLYCPYCGNKNARFSLNRLNEIFKSLQATPLKQYQPCLSITEVENCETRDPSHLMFRGSRSMDESSAPRSKFCTLCGKEIASEKEIERRRRQGDNNVYL